MSIRDQIFCAVTIRILGSLCYQNKSNQAFIRLTVIHEPTPPSIQCEILHDIGLQVDMKRNAGQE